MFPKLDWTFLNWTKETSAKRVAYRSHTVSILWGDPENKILSKSSLVLL